MTRFDATAAQEREQLVREAIDAHRERGSSFCTFEATPDEDELVPWIQYGDGLLNLDCTDRELDRLKTTLESYPELTITDLTRPEEAEGTNVRIEAYTDDDRVAAAVESIFRETYDQPASFRLWVTSV